MTRRVIAWACEYKCGRRVLTDRHAMERHEKTCKKNPARRTCATCKHEEWDPDGYYVECHKGLLEKEKEGPQMRFDCPGWELREED